MLKAKLPAAQALEARRAAKLVEQLDSGKYETRQSALKEAEKLGLGAEHPPGHVRVRVLGYGIVGVDGAQIDDTSGLGQWLARVAGLGVVEVGGPVVGADDGVAAAGRRQSVGRVAPGHHGEVEGQFGAGLGPADRAASVPDEEVADLPEEPAVQGRGAWQAPRWQT